MYCFAFKVGKLGYPRTLQTLIVKTLHAPMSDTFITWEWLYKQYLSLTRVSV